MNAPYLDAFAVIAASAPGVHDEEGKVCVAGNGMTRTHDYRAGAAAAVSGPEFWGWIPGPVGVADAIVAAVTRATTCVRPDGQGCVT